MVGEFLLESHEGLDRMDQDLLVLEREPNSPEAIARIFRTMHTIKGTCGFLGFSKTEAIAHAAESLLGGLRDGEYPVTPEVVTALLSAGDAIRQILAEIRTTGSEGSSAARGRRRSSRPTRRLAPQAAGARPASGRAPASRGAACPDAATDPDDGDHAPRVAGRGAQRRRTRPSASTWVCWTD